jgi:pimeloyl-ACP methyl ester carboxylesterase
MRIPLLALPLLLFTSPFAVADEDVAAKLAKLPGARTEEWHGYRRHHFQVAGRDAWVAVPNAARPGNPWSWCMEFPDSFTERCAAPALLAKGFHHAYINVGNTFGCPDAQKQLDAFYDTAVAAGLAKKAALIAISRGGLYAHGLAARHPERVSAIYGDAPVLDFRSWPAGMGKGRGNPKEWTALMKCYGFKEEADALGYEAQPIDRLEPLAKAKIALIYVVGDTDEDVPVAENTAVAEQRYKKLGGEVKVIHKPGVAHHPHGLDDPKPVVDFIVEKTVDALRRAP